MIYREQTWKILFYSFLTWASNTNGSNRIIGFSFVKPGTSAGNSDHLLTIVNDITIIPIRKTSIEFNIVEISHGKKTFVSTRKAKGTFFDLPIFSSGSGYSIGKLKRREIIKLFSTLKYFNEKSCMLYTNFYWHYFMKVFVYLCWVCLHFFVSLY